MEKILLADYLRKKYTGLYGKGHVAEDSVANYKKDRRKELIEILKILGLEEWLDDFKNINNSERTAYSFYVNELGFLDWIYLHYSDVLVMVRKNHCENISDCDAIFIYENLQQLFMNRGFEKEELSKRMEGPYNLLDYPIRKQNIELKKINTGIETLTNMIKEERLRTITSRNDDLAWISFISSDLLKKVNYYINLYDCMYESRQNEVLDYGEKKWNEMDEEQRKTFEEEEFFTLEVYTRCEELVEVKELRKKERDITGEPEEISLKMKWTPRVYTLMENKRLDTIHAAIKKHYDKIYEQVAKEHKGDKVLQNLFNKNIDYEFRGLRSSQTLLNESIEEIGT